MPLSIQQTATAFALAASLGAGTAQAGPQEECLSRIAGDWAPTATYLASKVAFTGNTTALYAVPRIVRSTSKDPVLVQPPATALMTISNHMTFVSYHNLTPEELAGPGKSVTADNLDDMGFLLAASPKTETFPDMVYARNANQKWAKFTLAFLDCLKLER